MATLFGGGQTYAQSGQAIFGRNRIQYHQQQWQYLVSNHFDVYYGQGGEAYARRSIEIAEQEYLRITEMIGYSPYNRIRFYLYDSPLRFSESNVGLETSPTLLGGKTSFLKSIIEVAYTRSQAELRRDIARGLARSMIYDMMYGGSFTEAVQNSYLMMLPEWFTEGAVAYAAEGWSMELDNWARDEAEAGRMRRLNARQGQEAEWLGQSLWAFMAERYGRSNVSNILNLTRIIRNEESAVSSTLGLPFGKVLREWRASYGALAEQSKQGLNALPDERILKIRLRSDDEIFGIALSPSGRFAAWACEEDGRTRLGIKDLMTNRQRVLWRQGERHQDMNAVPMSPVAFLGSDKVATVYQRGGKMELLIFKVSGKLFERFPLADIDQVQHLAFSEDGKKGVVIGSDHGQTDIYQINPKSGKIRKLTDDLVDEQDPVIDADGQYVYYASTQLQASDTVGLSSFSKRQAVRTRIYRLELSGKAKPERLVESDAALTAPILHPTLGLLALSDRSGVLNLVQADSGREGRPVTAYASSLLHIAYSAKADRAVALVRYDGRTRLLKLDSLQLSDITELPPTPWREAHPLRKPEAEAKELLHPMTAQQVAAPAPSPSPTAVDSAKRAPISPAPSVSSVAPAPRDTVPVETDPTINIRNYVFEEEKAAAPGAAKTAVPSQPRGLGQVPISASGLPPGPGSIVPGAAQTALPTLQELRSGRRLIQRDVYQPPILVNGPYPAGNKLSSNSVTTNLGIDPYRGWGILMQAAMSDYFENHRFLVTAQPFLDLSTANLAADYQFLKHRVDFSAHFAKNALQYTSDAPLRAQKNYQYVYQVGASYPFSRSFRASLFPYYQQTNFYNLYENTPIGQVTRSYVGGRFELVFDNSFTSSSNITTGTKMKFVVEQNAGMRNSGTSFGSVFLDLRRYQKIHKELTLALRASAGRFFGPAKKQYMLGGMDNWLFNNFTDHSNESRKDDPMTQPALATQGRTDWFFNPFVTNMRGFDYNTMYGNNFILLNAELRLPMIKYLYKGPIASNFLRNFMLVGFTDVGSAWSGKSLLSKENSINTTVTTQGPFTITTINSRNPFLVGYGVGARTMMLGYYVKFDFALGKQDNAAPNKRYYLTLGYDF